MTEITTLAPADRAMIVLSSSTTEAQLRGMVQDAASITDVIDPDGREQAHRMGMKLRTARTTIEKAGKAARDDANAFAKAVIDEQKRLIGITEGEERRIMELRDAYDAKIEAEKEAIRKAEADRVRAIQDKIAQIMEMPRQMVSATADEIAIEREALAQFTPSEDEFQEFVKSCGDARSFAMAELEKLHAGAVARETAAAALAEERARLDAERAAFEAEQAEFRRKQSELMQAEEAMRAASAQPEQETLVENGAEIEPSKPEPEPTDVLELSKFVEATARQFEAMAAKSAACGATDFADQLMTISGAVRSRAYDAAIAAAERKPLADADLAMIVATDACLSAMGVD